MNDRVGPGRCGLASRLVVVRCGQDLDELREGTEVSLVNPNERTRRQLGAVVGVSRTPYTPAAQFDAQVSGWVLDNHHSRSPSESASDPNSEMTMTKQRIGVCLVTVILALGVSPSLAGADGDSLRDKKEKVEQVKDVAEDVGEGDAKDKAKDAAKEEAKDQAGDAAREAAGVGKGPK